MGVEVAVEAVEGEEAGDEEEVLKLEELFLMVEQSDDCALLSWVRGL